MIEGSCHCGAVHWRFEGVPETATTCNCSICRRHGALWAYGFEDEAFTVTGEMSAYSWGRKQLAFHFCATCACVVVWLTTSRGEDGRNFGAVNLRLANDPNAVSAVPLRHHVTEIHDDLPLDGKRVSDVWA